ncbi:MAG: histidine phosphatase family protein [Nanoarchaeota archaeon]
MRLIITRHGETEENKQGIIQGHLPGHLSKEGRAQAQKLALRLKDERIDYIYASDLARAADTASIIHKYHADTPIEFVTALREKKLGEWEGKKKTDIGLSISQSVSAYAPKGAETTEQIFERAKAFLDEVISKHRDGTVLLVGHNGINKALIAVITGKHHADIGVIENQRNTAITIYDIDEDSKHRMHVFNCTRHLQ